VNRLRLGLSVLAVAGVLASAGCVTSSPHLGGGYPSPAVSAASAAPSGSAGPSGAPSTGGSPSATSTAPTRVDCAWGPANPGSTTTGTPPKGAPATGTAAILIVTNLGSITIDVDRSVTPCTVASFAYLATSHFFDESPCHRLTTAGIYVLQCGDPTGTGRGGPSYTIPDEALPSQGPNMPAVTYPRGVVAMANASRPNTGGSQFFLVYKDSVLPDSYTKFGTITSGIEVLDSVALAGVNSSSTDPNDGPPKLAVKILSLSLIN
jgi:peptidyl-prolyl cis-trans isomerase B (cyclophilin B)